METKTDNEQAAMDELQYVLDLSGFRHNIAYNIIGIQSPAIFRSRVNPGIRQLMLDNIQDMTDCIKEQLATGEYPDAIDRENEEAQLTELFNNYIQNKHK